MARVLRTLRRTAWQAVPTVVAIVVIDFFLLRLAPGDAADAADALAAESGSATEETMAALRAHFGLDQPAVVQFFSYIGNLLHFSLGSSPLYNMPDSHLIGERLPGSLLLMATALSLALPIGTTSGVVMSVFAGRLIDRVPSVIALLFYSVPGFWVGLMLIVVFSVWLGWLPSGGAETIGAGLTGLAELALLVVVIVAALLAPVLFPGDPLDMVTWPFIWPLQDPALYLVALPGAALVTSVLSLNLVGDGLNDALNPRARGR